MAKRFIEVVHNRCWNTDGEWRNEREQREIVPIDSVLKVKHLWKWEEELDPNTGYMEVLCDPDTGEPKYRLRYAIAIWFVDPLDGVRRCFTEELNRDEFWEKWKSLQRQLDHLLERSAANGEK